VVWFEPRITGQNDVYAQRVSPAGDSPQQDADFGKVGHPRASERDDADGDRDEEESQDAFGAPVAPCGAIPPPFLLATFAGVWLTRWRR
jgi:hypothetical protein